MEPGALLWTFVEECQRATSIDQLSDKFLSEMARLGFPHVALSSHVDPLKPPPGAVMILRYPPSWVEHYSAEHCQTYDPVFEAAMRRSRPFHWDEPSFLDALTPTQRQLLNEGSEAGVAHGFTIPVRGPDALPASCSLIPDPDGVDPRHYPLIHYMSVFMHETSRRLHAAPIISIAPQLTRRERECLTLVARGKSDWVISTLLGVSEKAVSRTIERARAKFGVATRTQAIVRALYSGAISLYDAME
jgi:DNA-binding CsgD family transcriptional regulator